MSGIIFCVFSTSAISAYFASDGEKDARTGRRRQDRGKVRAHDDEPGLHCLDKFFDCADSGCVEKPGDTQSALWKILVKYREIEAKEYNQDAASSSQGWQKDAVPDVGTRKLVASGKSEIEGSDKIGHTIPFYQQTTCRTCRSSRSLHKDMVSVRWIN